MKKDAVKSTRSDVSVRFLLAIAGLGGLLYGVDFGVIAAAEPYLMSLGLYSGSQVSLVVGAVMMGGLLSSLTAGVLCDFLGRKKMIVAASAMFLLAVPIVCLSVGSFPVLFAGRMLQGMSAGYMSVVMPMYLTETLPPEIRGRGTGVFQFFLG
ncbi:MAG: MFS transporter, partial [Kiritimatiellae bacterium]|nr:MFS transporter [Kiritimatiellia bacterium]